MMMWRFGGMYLDHKMFLAAPLSDWLDLSADKIPLFNDVIEVAEGENGKAVWQGILWSPRPKHFVWEAVLKHQIKMITERPSCDQVYQFLHDPNGQGCCLGITGPVAVFRGLQSHIDDHSFAFDRDFKFWSPEEIGGFGKDVAGDREYGYGVGRKDEVIAFTDHSADNGGLSRWTGFCDYNEDHTGSSFCNGCEVKC